jgi:hypothetical protein
MRLMLREPELGDLGLLDRIFFSPRQRRTFGEVVLATYRVELTRTLSQLASRGIEEGDAELVHELAARIEATAGAVRFDAVVLAAATLRERAAAATPGAKREEGAMLVAGLKLIDRILESTRRDEVATSRSASLN